jgi:hypothetical protein
LNGSDGNQKSKFASHALVFMLAGVTTRWKQVIGYQFTGNSYEARQANEIILCIIKKCHSIKLNVCAVVSDMGPQNQALWRINNITAGRFSRVNNVQKYQISENETKDVFFLPDATHVYKNIRIALTEGNTFYIAEEIASKYNLPSQEISIEPIKMVIEADKNVDLKIAPYLKEIYIQPNHYDKMKVQGAMAILNHDVSAAIKFYISKGKIPEKHLTTAWFLEYTHKWYNIMSARTVKLGLSKNNMDEYNATVNFLEEILHITTNIHIGSGGYWKPFQKGIMLATKGVLDLQKKFLNVYNFHYILPSRFTQDALENLFSNVRARNPVPNAKEFKTALRLITISQYFAQPKHGNYGVTDDVPLIDFLSKDKDEDNIDIQSFLGFTCITDNIGLEEKESLFCLVGSIIKNIKTNNVHCANCISSVTADNTESVSEFKHLVDLKSYKEGSLMYPSRTIFDVVLKAELLFRTHAQQLIGGKLKLEHLTPLFLNSVSNSVQFPNCHTILKHVIVLFFKCRIHILLRQHYSCSRPADSVKCSSKSIGMRVAVLNFK